MSDSHNQPPQVNSIETTFTRLPPPGRGIHVYRPNTAREYGCSYVVESLAELRPRERRDYRRLDFGLRAAEPVALNATEPAQFPRQEVLPLATRENSSLKHVKTGPTCSGSLAEDKSKAGEEAAEGQQGDSNEDDGDREDDNGSGGKDDALQAPELVADDRE